MKIQFTNYTSYPKIYLPDPDPARTGIMPDSTAQGMDRLRNVKTAGNDHE